MFPETSSKIHKVRNQQPRNLLAVNGIEYVVFNRVPKCASMSMTQLSYDLSGRNNFKVESPYEPGEKQTKTETEQTAFKEYLFAQESPYMYIRHQYYVEFEKKDESKIAYINMIRDPIARFESFYYFSRFGNNLGGGGHAKLDEAQKQETIDECVQKKRFCCKSPWWQVVPYLCGQDPRCSEKSEESRKWAVERAKKNVDEKYLFVGVLEELSKSLAVLESLLPSYFLGANEMTQAESSLKMRTGTLTKNKTPASEKSRKYLKEETSLKYEYELYYYVLAKLQKTYGKLINPDIL